MNLKKTKIKDLQPIFRKKGPIGLTLHIMSTNILFGYTDTVLGRRYTIGMQFFSTNILWD